MKELCLIQDCTNRMRSKGFCLKHYDMMFYRKEVEGRLKNLIIREEKP